MKYLNLYESYIKSDHNISDLDELIPELDVIFYELEDVGFDVFLSSTKTKNIDFSDGPISTTYNKLNDTDIQCIELMIVMRDDAFNISDIKENLLFAESYMVDVFDLKINFIEVRPVKGNKTIYYQSAEYLPNDEMVYLMYIDFIKV